MGCFHAGRISLQDDHQEGRPATVAHTISLEQVKTCIDQDRCKTMRDVAPITKISKSSIHMILRQELNMQKMYSKMVPKVLTPEQKQTCVFMAETFLNNLESDDSLLSQIITGDES